MNPSLATALCLIAALRVHPVGGHLEVNPLSYLKHSKVKVELDYNIELHADPGLLNKSGEWVNVSWAGVFFPTKQDWLGVWVLPNSSVSIDARKQAPIKFQYCSFVKTHAFGYGQMKFFMVNMRGVYQFALFRGGRAIPDQFTFTNCFEVLR